MKTLLRRLEESLEKNKEKLIRFYFSVFITFLIITFVFYFPYIHVIGSLDVSMSRRFYLKILPPSDEKEKEKAIRKHGYVEIFVGDLEEYPPIKEKKVLYLIKKVVCFPGDYLIAENGKFYCNGRLIAEAHPESPSPPISFRGRIPEGMFFAVGEHPKSFDSRYIGLIPSRRITGLLIPLF